MELEYVMNNSGIRVGKYQLSLMWTLISWPIIYLLIFVTQPSWILGDGGYLQSFSSTSGTPTTEGKGGNTNTIMSDSGRTNALWVSFLFSLIVGLFAFLLYSY